MEQKDFGNIRYVWSAASGLRPFVDQKLASNHFAVEMSRGGDVYMIYEHGYSVMKAGASGHPTDHDGRPTIPGIGVV